MPCNNFRGIALKNRRLLLLSLSYWQRKAGNGPAGTATELTKKAVHWGYVQARESPSGATLTKWIKTGEVPAWAAKTAARLLLCIEGYKPASKEEICALALALTEAFPSLSAEELQNLIPLDLREDLWKSVFQNLANQ